VIVTPKNPRDWQAMAQFLNHYAHVHPSTDLRLIGWVSDDKLVIVAGFNAFMGKVAQIHIAFAEGWHFSPRAMLDAVFHHGFIEAGRDMLIGLVNSNNHKALRLDTHLGFREVFRLPGMHDDGGDLIVLAMKKDECRYIRSSRVLLEKTGSD